MGDKSPESVCLFVCVSVNALMAEPFDILSQKVRSHFSVRDCKRNERGDSNHIIYFEWPDKEGTTREGVKAPAFSCFEEL